MTDLYIVRHGNTFDKGDVVTRVGARTDLPLSRSGEVQAKKLAEQFAGLEAEGFSRAFCSPLQRTRQTADAILAESLNAPTLDELEFLREVDYGPDENQPEGEVIARVGEAAMRRWEERAIPPVGWEIDPDQIKQAWRDLFAEMAAAALTAPVLLVTSNGIARFALDAVTNFVIEPESIKLKTGAYGRLRLQGASVSLLDWNVRP